MRFVRFFAVAVTTCVLVILAANGQPPPDGPKGDKGPKGLKGLKGLKALNTNSEQLLVELKLSDEQRRKARDILRAHDEKMRDAARQAREELLAKMKDVLDEGEFKAFKEELAQVPLLPSIPAVLRTVSADDLIERLMAFDKNGDGKITKDELPERMHALFEQGDTNRDGALDREEIKRLAERAPPGPGGPGRSGGPPPGPPFPKRP
jgi:Spy/CpxP family protein refolding chaperone